MNRFAALFLLLLMAGTSSVFAQADVIIKNKAKAIRDANNAQQGVTPAQPAAPAPGAPAASGTNAPRGIDPAQQANIDKLADDFSGIKAGVRVPLGQRTQMQADMLALAKGTVKPSGQSLTNLVKDLSSALAGKNAALKETGPAQLARNINIVVNSGKLTAGQVQPVIIATRNILLTGGVPEEDYKPVVEDLNVIVAELQKGKAKPTASSP
jgi:hypothetical protein